MSDLKTLFANYEAANLELEAAKKVVEEKEHSRSDIVKAIYEAAGKGPFTFKGEQKTVVIRGETYFFRSPKGTAIKIDE
jgi:hypothetical protein